MAFTLSGTTITQTGVDADLSGLSAISGVTATTNGLHTTYSTSHIVIQQGTVTINPTTEKFFSTANVNGTWVLKSGSILQVGEKILLNGFEDTTKGVAMDFYGVGNYSQGGYNNGLQAESGSTLRVYGATITGSLLPRLQAGSILDFKDAVFKNTDLTGSRPEYRHETGLGSVDGLKVIDYSFATFLGVQPTFKGFAPTHITLGAIATSGATADRTWLDFNDYNGKGNTVDPILYSDTFIRLINAVNGTNQKIRGEGSHSQNTGIVEITKEFSLKVEDDNGDVQGAKLYIKDNDNGNRVDFSATEEYKADRIYQVTSDINGQMTTVTVLTGVATRGGSTGRSATGTGDFNTGVNVVDLRGKTNILGSDDFDGSIISYSHSIKPISLTLKGADVLSLTEKVFTDFSITESTKATVAAYTTIDNAQQFYDRAKAYLVDNYAGEIATIVTRSGNVLDAGSYNITIDTSATGAFAFAINTLTIKSSGYSSGLKTTGTITIKDGVDITGMYIDGDVLVEGEMKNITNVEVTGSLRFDSNVDKEIVIANSKLNILENLGTGQLSFENQNSTITDITDAEVILLEDVFTINLTNILAGSSVWIGDTSKDTLQYLVNQSGTYSFTSVRGYSNNLYYVVKKAGFSVFKGVITVDGTSTSTNISVTQTEVKDTDGTNMYGGGLTSANLTFTKLADKVTGSVTSDITAKVFYDEFQLFGESEDGCIWLSSNLDMQRITAGAGKQQIIYEKNINVNNGSLAGTYIIQSEVISQESPFDISLMGSVQSASSVGISASDIWDYLQTNTTIVGSMKEKIESSVKLVDIENSEILAKKAHLEVLNNNIKDSSILVPANRDLL